MVVGALSTRVWQARPRRYIGFATKLGNMRTVRTAVGLGTHRSRSRATAARCHLGNLGYPRWRVAIPAAAADAQFLSSTGGGPDRRAQLERENAAKLRAMRDGGTTPSAAAAAAEDKVDYRYRGDGGGGGGTADRSSSISALWGEAAREAESERQRWHQRTHPNKTEETDLRPSLAKGRRKFVSFFDEVDAIMEQKRKSEGYRASYVDVRDESPLAERWSSRSLFAGSAEERKLSAPPPPNLSTIHSGRKSIFDVFPAEPIKPPSPNAFDRKSYEQYRETIEQVLDGDYFQNGKIVKRASTEFLEPLVEWLLKDEPVLPYKLSELDEVKENSVSDTLGEKDVTQSKTFRNQLKDQREAFLQKTGLTDDHYELAERAMKILLDFCAKRCKAAPVEVAWEKIKEAGMMLKEDTMNTLLFVVSTGGLGLTSSFSSSLHDGPLSFDSLLGGRSGSILDSLGEVEAPSYTTLENSKKEGRKKSDIKEEVSVFHDILFGPSEKSISLRIKSMISRGDGKGAESLLERFKVLHQDSDEEVLKLRTYLPILKHYCEQGDVSSALSLFKVMRKSPTVLLEPENYVLLIATVAENGYFRSDSEPITSASELGYSAACGPDLFDELAEEMSEDVLEISSALARRLYNSFAVGFKGKDMAKNLKPMHSLAGMFPMNEPAEDGELVASRVTVDAKTALCPRTKATLRLIILKKDERKQLHDTLLDLATAEGERFSKVMGGDYRRDAEYPARELSNFAKWLNDRSGPPFTAIVDGANVAYYMQNFDQGKFNYYQVQFVVDALVSMKENPLVIVPHKYTKPKFFVATPSSGAFQYLGPKELAIADNLHKNGQLYAVPSGCLDDFYWILASVSDQTNSRSGADLDVPTNNVDGRWPGTRPMLVSNDQTRDHKLMMMEPRLFRRWYSCHIVNYNFTAFVDDECVDREIGLSPPDFFSREIQGNPTPGGGTDSGGGGTAWHIPVSDWDLDDRFCIRIPRQI